MSVKKSAPVTVVAKASKAKPAARKVAAGKTGEDMTALPSARARKPGVPPRVSRLVRQSGDWADSLIGLTASALDIAINLANQKVSNPKQKAVLKKAGSLLRGARETAGLSIDELARALDGTDPGLLDQAESGKALLPIEIILRLTTVLGRQDPLGFFLNLTRNYNPRIWKTLDELGLGRLIAQSGREREFVAIYRSNEGARALSDEQFARLLSLVQSAFELGMAYADGASAGKAGANGKA